MFSLNTFEQKKKIKTAAKLNSTLQNNNNNKKKRRNVHAFFMIIM